MLKICPNPTAAHVAEIERLKEDSLRARRLEQESWERSDTDGFLSQWAHQMTVRLNERKIELLKNAGYAQFRVLCDEQGEVIATKIYIFENRHAGYGVVERWKLPLDIAEKCGRKWVPTGCKSRIQKQIGVHEEYRWFPAEAKIASRGTGLGGCASAYVTVEKAC